MTDEDEAARSEAAYRLNEYWLSLRIFGEAAAQTELSHIVGIAPYEMRDSQGTVRQRNPHVAVFNLEEWLDDRQSNDILLQLATRIKAWTPALQQLRATYQYRLEIYISAFRNTDLGGIDFPLDFIRALADAEISFGISIQALFLWDDDEDDNSAALH